MLSTAEHLTDEELATWLAFDRVSGTGLGLAKVSKIYEHFEGLAPAWSASRSQLLGVIGLSEDIVDKLIERRKELDPEKLLADLRKADIRAYPFCSPDYPHQLKQIHDPPMVLYAAGQVDLDELDFALGIVGSRNPTHYGQRLAKEFAHGLAAIGIPIVSGMAYGVDSLAHRAAIEAGGKTMAVFGCGVDLCYPSSNKPLYKLLTQGEQGGVVSEFFPGTKPDSWRFPARNRIISGLTKGIVVIEAGETSGSLITARLAFEQSREVFAIPGRIDSPLSRGTNHLIAKDMAHLVTCVQDILDSLEWAVAGSVPESSPDTPPPEPKIIQLFGREKEIFELLSAEPVQFDVLIERTGMAAGELSAALTMLELGSLINRLPGDWYVRSSSVHKLN